ncbi:MAG: NAD-binding protein, partial [Chloroflexota bacterium]|nr:NAD-binding protein [Chloroflexota bacterium]
MANRQVKRMEGYDVVIAGAGTTACMLAKDLTQRGKKVILLEEGDDSRKFLNGTVFSMMLGGHQKKMGSFMGCVTREGDRVL